MENQQQPTTTLCRAGCGFFGASATENFCSKCYKDHIQRQQDTARVSPTLSVPVVMAASPSSCNSSSSPSSSSTSSVIVASTASEATPTTTTSSTSTSTAVPILSSASLAEKTMTCSQAALSAEDQVAKLESAAATAEVTLSSSRLLKRKRPNDVDHEVHVDDDESSAVCLESASPVAPAPLDNGPPAKKVNRCNQCKKRVGLTGFECRCGGLYCSEHRYDTAHSCSFDYKTMEREQIAKNNPVVVSEKIQRL